MATSNDNSNPSHVINLLRTCLAANVGFSHADAKRRWPWLKEVVPLPCDCQRIQVPIALLVLQHLYDTHVCDRKDWSAERLETWVRTKAAEM